MQIPKRRHQLLHIREDEGAYYLTPAAKERMERDLHDLENVQHPRAVEDVSIAVQKGDLSENAEYTEAKARLARIDGRIFSIKERLKRVVLIEKDGSGTILLGSTVLLWVNGKQKSYTIVGPHETNPAQGRISHQSPLGVALLHHVAGDTVHLETEQGIVEYQIIEVA
jgi:transcription elongation factor GreA